MVIAWSIARRNGARPLCIRSHNRWVTYLPTSETVQVLTLTSFMQLNLAFVMHIVSTGSYEIAVAHGLTIAFAGILVRSIFNALIQGSNNAFVNSLNVAKIDVRVPGWSGELRSEGVLRSPKEENGHIGATSPPAALTL